MTEWISGILILLGSFWLFISALGVFRFPDTYSRIHAASKASSLGLVLLLAGAALQVGRADVWAICFLVVLFIFATNPIAAHFLSRAAHGVGYPASPLPHIDEMSEHKKNPKSPNPPRSY